MSEECRKFNRELRQTQAQHEEKVKQIMTDLAIHSAERSVDYKECEELAKCAGRMSNRWKRTTSVIVETLSTLEGEIDAENEKLNTLESFAQSHADVLSTITSENKRLDGYLRHLENQLAERKQMN